MNTKVLASLGVVVALLTAWLFVSLYRASTTSVVAPSGSELSQGIQRSVPAPSLGAGRGGTILTSVFVPNSSVATSVTIAE